jgi:hypothetical protein
VSDVKELEIRIRGNKIARGDSLPLSLTARTSDGKEMFPLDQLNIMEIGFENASKTHVDISMDPCPRDSEDEGSDSGGGSNSKSTGSSSSTTVRQFCVTGLRVGNTEVKFYVHHHDGRRVYSQPLSLTIFEPLLLTPRRLVLLPGSKVSLYFGRLLFFIYMRRH